MRGRESTFRILSRLLHYPDPDLVGALGTLREISGALEEGISTACLQFLDYLGGGPMLSLQESYTRTFDFCPDTSLNLTHHLFGDDKGRGGALAALSRIYRDAGYEVACGELPDYLPMILEFLSLEPGKAAMAEVADSCGGALGVLASRLREARNPYAGLVSAACDLLHPMGRPS
ncbi:MAG: nitrate reductase molybdenum cofactor assembly chaperone [Thermodesulfobacteriota bacterium]